MPAQVFINYRRDDDAGHAGRLYERLRLAYGEDKVFKDTEGSGLRPGTVFPDALHRKMAECEVVLCVIGPKWLRELKQHNAPECDWVVAELEAAFQQRKRVIPVLVGGAGMPRANELPFSIQELARLECKALPPQDFGNKCDELVANLDKLLGTPQGAPIPDVPKQTELEARLQSVRAQALLKGGLVGVLEAAMNNPARTAGIARQQANPPPEQTVEALLARLNGMSPPRERFGFAPRELPEDLAERGRTRANQPTRERAPVRQRKVEIED